MRDISVFDVIGPNMIGPSSSHTAGALKIALMAKRIIGCKVMKAHFILYGSFARTYRGHGTDRALIAGILNYGTEDRRIRDAFKYADEAGLEYEFSTNTTNQDVHPNTVEMVLTDEHGESYTIVGESIGGGEVNLRKLNGIEISLDGNYHTLLVQMVDKPGTLAHVTKCMSDWNVNIAFLRLYRESKGEAAYAILEIDGAAPKEALDAMLDHELIHKVTDIQL